MKNEFNKKEISYTIRVNVFTGRMIHAPGSKLVPTFALDPTQFEEKTLDPSRVHPT